MTKQRRGKCWFRNSRRNLAIISFDEVFLLAFAAKGDIEWLIPDLSESSNGRLESCPLPVHRGSRMETVRL
jgi:hypothetical protein